jgi:hypothetical protein
MVLGKLDIHLQKTDTRSQSLTLNYVNEKWVKNLTVRSETEIIPRKNRDQIDLGNNSSSPEMKRKD